MPGELLAPLYDELGRKSLTIQDLLGSVAYPNAELRRPIGLPLDDVWMGVPVSLSEVVDPQGFQWPPSRGYPKQQRLIQQRDAAQGRFHHWLQTPQDVIVNCIGDLEDTVTALLMTNPPEPDGEPDLQLAIQSALESAAVDMVRHGTGYIVGRGEQLDWWDARYVWPLAEGGWLCVMPEISGMATSQQPDTVVVRVWMDGVLTAVKRTLSSSPVNPKTMSVGPVIEAQGVETGVVFAPCHRPPISHGHGTSLVDRLIPLAVELVRRESGTSYSIDRNERPLTQFLVSLQQLMEEDIIEDDGSLSDRGSTTLQAIKRLLSEATVLRQNDTVFLPEGIAPAVIGTWDQNIDGALGFLARLDMKWVQATGFPLIEPGDSGSNESGITVARRNAMGVARVRSQIYAPLYYGLSDVLGRAADWTFVDTDEIDEAEPTVDPMEGMGMV